ncbi:hypothetical protein [Pseudorhodoferax sp.]|uniref:hypothetical protein n=1 Tax=Pseudorhodoferax sp. TaxID=1993553 RepID=UPI0039E2350F
MRLHLRNPLLALCLAASASAHADIVIGNAFINFETRGLNSLGFTDGTFLRFGANSVIDSATGTAAGISGIATTTDLATGELVQRTISYNPGPVVPNFFSRYLPLTTNAPPPPNAYQPWTLNFSNGSQSASTVVRMQAGSAPIGFVSSIALSGTAAAPNFRWTPPASDAVQGYRVNIYDRSLINNNPANGPLSTGQVVSLDLQRTDYTVDPSHFSVPGYAFVLGKPYTIEISALQTRDGSTDTRNSNLQAMARVYADFTPTDNGDQQVQLPVRRDDGSFAFNFTVVPDQLYYIDPSVAVGYDYQTGAGDPNFRTLVLPSDIGDGRYDLWLWDGSDWLLAAHDWLGGQVFDFGLDGVDRFRVTGIEVAAGLDPEDTTAFVTGVSFTGAGRFTGTQTPITQEVQDVPEPPVGALLLMGGAALMLHGRRTARVPDAPRRLT